MRWRRLAHASFGLLLYKNQRWPVFLRRQSTGATGKTTLTRRSVCDWRSSWRKRHGTRWRPRAPGHARRGACGRPPGGALLQVGSKAWRCEERGRRGGRCWMGCLGGPAAGLAACWCVAGRHLRACAGRCSGGGPCAHTRACVDASVRLASCVVRRASASCIVRGEGVGVGVSNRGCR